MDDLISRQAAFDALDGKIEITGRANAEAVKGYVRLVKDRLERLPSAQPEIIRCKDCRYYQDNNDGYPHINCKWDANETPDADDFCSGAERRTDG